MPRGSVVTYGQVAQLLGVARGARAVGWALGALSDERAREIPWHRVVGSGGRIAHRGGPGPILQVRLLRAEGVRFTSGRVDVARHGATTSLWGRARTAKAAAARTRRK